MDIFLFTLLQKLYVLFGTIYWLFHFFLKLRRRGGQHTDYVETFHLQQHENTSIVVTIHQNHTIRIITYRRDNQKVINLFRNSILINK